MRVANQVGIAPGGPAANEWIDADSGPLGNAPVPVSV